jgi:hypothetical protein
LLTQTTPRRSNHNLAATKLAESGCNQLGIGKSEEQNLAALHSMQEGFLQNKQLVRLGTSIDDLMPVT